MSEDYKFGAAVKMTDSYRRSIAASPTRAPVEPASDTMAKFADVMAKIADMNRRLDALAPVEVVSPVSLLKPESVTK